MEENTEFLIAARRRTLHRFGTIVSRLAVIKAVGTFERDIRAADNLDGGHAIAEERADRSRPKEIAGHGLARVERRDQNQV
jgi:hypothetical protein